MNVLRSATACAVALALASCSTVSTRPLALDDARDAVRAARADPQVATYAAAEYQDAAATYERAESLLRTHADVDEIKRASYLARQRASIAQEIARLRYAQDAVAAATTERERETLVMRAEQAEAATRAALLAEAQAESEQRAREARGQPSKAAPPPRAEKRAVRNVSVDNELRELVATRSDRGTVVTMNDVLFDPGNATLRPGGRRLVARLADIMRAYPDRAIAIEGFSDSGGNDALAQELSLRRAEAVRLGLVDAGIDGSRVAVRGYGGAFPVASNETLEGRVRNRRVEVVISNERGGIAPRIASSAGR